MRGSAGTPTDGSKQTHVTGTAGPSSKVCSASASSNQSLRRIRCNPACASAANARHGQPDQDPGHRVGWRRHPTDLTVPSSDDDSRKLCWRRAWREQAAHRGCWPRDASTGYAMPCRCGWEGGNADAVPRTRRGRSRAWCGPKRCGAAAASTPAAQSCPRPKRSRGTLPASLSSPTGTGLALQQPARPVHCCRRRRLRGARRGRTPAARGRPACARPGSARGPGG